MAYESFFKSPDLYKAIVNLANEGIIVYDAEFRHVLWNRQMEVHSGFKSEQVLGKTPHDLFPFLDTHLIYSYFKRALVGQSFDIELSYLYPPTGKVRWTIDTYSPLRDEANRILGVICMVKDITLLKEYQTQLEFLSFHDPLTGLYNRGFFENELKRLSGSRDYPISILSCDLNALKIINDTLGHEPGDIFIKNCAQTLIDTLRDSDIIARVGGDEFSAILTRTDEQDCQNIVSRIKGSLSPLAIGDVLLPMSMAIGYATAKTRDTDLKRTVKEADQAMYQMKIGEKAFSKDNILGHILNILGEKDGLKNGHGKRLYDYTMTIASLLNLSSEALGRLEKLATFHDLGLISLPKDVLERTGPLTDEEWLKMKLHPEYGARIASAFDQISYISDLILKHQEWWNGEGYPLGLKGEGIPIECRIFSVADAYDAMTFPKPYKAPIDKSKALAEIKRLSGIQFDPYVVRIFENIV